MTAKRDKTLYLPEESIKTLETIDFLARQFLGLFLCALVRVVLSFVVFRSLFPFVLDHFVVSFVVIRSLFPLVLDRFLDEIRLKPFLRVLKKQILDFRLTNKCHITGKIPLQNMKKTSPRLT